MERRAGDVGDPVGDVVGSRDRLSVPQGVADQRPKRQVGCRRHDLGGRPGCWTDRNRDDLPGRCGDNRSPRRSGWRQRPTARPGVAIIRVIHHRPLRLTLPRHPPLVVVTVDGGKRGLDDPGQTADGERIRTLGGAIRLIVVVGDVERAISIGVSRGAAERIIRMGDRHAFRVGLRQDIAGRVVGGGAAARVGARLSSGIFSPSKPHVVDSPSGSTTLVSRSKASSVN